MAGIPPTGNDMDVTAIAVHRIRDGVIVEHWGEVDSFALMTQLGLIPSQNAELRGIRTRFLTRGPDSLLYSTGEGLGGGT